eukprot:CAMPEP_0168559646 /NCGR_PEP_ID=MMETSP0413-20121227/10636_1 /TAXON_ID=136452 /ORGANISM="Filamoeba nolandi, Strain NC-AS-23-1" /LENGTH=312 /DNA_ID=CAMNT_0008590891 /DNA_START=51 /DNA_END=989 /DNA_ORIENTATION=+
MGSSALNLDKCLDQLFRCELLAENTIKDICEKVKELLIDESNVTMIRSPITIVGDIHGQFHDLLEIFRIGGKSPDTNYLFLGNYVDRGSYSVETISLLLCLKLKYPNRVFLLRGNHETRALTQVHGFYAECVRKYGNSNVWKYMTDMFDYLTVAAIIDDKIIAMHAGLSSSISSIDQLRVINRFQEVPPESPLTDILWSDPDPERDGFNFSPRGAGCTFGQAAVKQFLLNNKLEHIVRSHQLCMDGYQLIFDNKLSTIWSAPNYLSRCGNVACVLEVGEDLERHYNTFLACPESERQRPTYDTMKEIPDYYT